MTAPPNPKHILVTGGCGFIGANLVSMPGQRDYTIQVLDNLSKGNKEFFADPRGEAEVTATPTHYLSPREHVVMARGRKRLTSTGEDARIRGKTGRKSRVLAERPQQP